MEMTRKEESDQQQREHVGEIVGGDRSFDPNIEDSKHQRKQTDKIWKGAL